MMKKLIVICSILTVAIAGSNALGGWVEIGDAGDLPGTAQAVIGGGPLDGISGVLGESDFGDMYKIKIYDPLGFSAATVGTGFDPQLFLFDASGMGVYANDDSNLTLESLLPSAHAFSPTTPGLYYLAITDFDRDAYSTGGLIFPSTPFSDVHGPTGAGGGAPVTYWVSSFDSPGAYTIELTGAATIPAPGAILLGGIGAGLVGWLRRRRTL